MRQSDLTKLSFEAFIKKLMTGPFPEEKKDEKK